MKHYCEDITKVLTETQSSADGLSTQEAEARLAANGKNKLAEAKKDSLLKRFVDQLTDPMIIILLAAAAISGVLAVVEGESFADVIIILAVVIVNAVLGVYQENKAEKAIEALQEMSAATSKVLRDGKIQTVNSMKYHTRTIKETLGIDFKFHHLRHTYGTLMAEMNTPTHLLCNQMGHGNIHVTQKYYIAISKTGIDVLQNNLNRL